MTELRRLDEVFLGDFSECLGFSTEAAAALEEREADRLRGFEEKSE